MFILFVLYLLFLVQSGLISFYFYKTRKSPYWKMSAFVVALILVGLTVGIFTAAIYLLKVPGSAYAVGPLFMSISVCVSFILGFAIVPLVIKVMPKVVSFCPDYRDYT